MISIFSNRVVKHRENPKNMGFYRRSIKIAKYVRRELAYNGTGVTTDEMYELRQERITNENY